jgi:SAM-dependent methyltransferase
MWRSILEILKAPPAKACPHPPHPVNAAIIHMQPYLSLEAELHDHFWAAEDDASEVPLITDFLRTHPGRTLEIGCGSGRLTLPLLQAGFEIEGLELSADMLEIFRTRASHLPTPPVLHLADMSDWQPTSPYHSLLAPAFTLQLSADPLATLRHWHTWLIPGGALYLTLFIPFAEMDGHLPAKRWYADHQATLPDGRRARLETRHSIDLRQKILHRQHRYRVNGTPPQQYRSAQTLRWFMADEIPTLLTQAGFQITQAFPDFQPHLPLPQNPNLQTETYDGILTYHTLQTPT